MTHFQTIKVVIDNDSWQHILSFCNYLELCRVGCTSRSLESLSSSSVIWEHQCLLLWKNKQNHPLERWMKIFPSPKIQSNLEMELSVIMGVPIQALEEDGDYVNEDDMYNDEFSNFNVNGIMAMHDAILEELEAMQGLLLTGNVEAIHSFSVLMGRLQSIGHHLNHAKSLEKLTEIRASERLDGNVIPRRIFAPISRVIRANQIRSERSSLRNLWKTNLASTNPNLMRNEIINLYTKDIDYKRFVEVAEEAGLILTWKQSYAESIQDAKRRFITHEELREQGDWLILFDETLEMCRFVHGGAKFIDGRAFSHHIGSVGLQGDRLYFREIHQAAAIYRTEDWGWLIVCDNGYVSLSSFDRKAGKDAYSGDLLQHTSQGITEVQLAESTLLLDPLHDVYSLL